MLCHLISESFTLTVNAEAYVHFLFQMRKFPTQAEKQLVYTAAFQYLKGTYKKAGEGLFSRVCSDRTRGKGLKLKEDRLKLDSINLWSTGGDWCAISWRHMEGTVIFFHLQ